MVNNGDWLRKLNYIDCCVRLARDFTVNRMLAVEAYKQRWEKGLTFLEFNYMVMQAYDFLRLNRRYGCKLEMGGDDQWSNIIAGVELNRRKNSTAVYGLTNKLLTKSDGEERARRQVVLCGWMQKRPARMSSISTGATLMMRMSKNACRC